MYSAIPYESGYVLATGGGIQFSTPKTKRLFTSADGLGTTSFYAVAQSDSKIYGISEYGLIAAYDKASSHWSVENRSYLNNKVAVVPGQAVVEKNNLVIAFENRLAFYDTDQKAFLLTIDKIGGISLASVTPQKISSAGDSLFVLLGKDVYARKMDWDNMAKDMRLVDPSSWVKKTGSKNTSRYFGGQISDFSKIKRETKKKQKKTKKTCFALSVLIFCVTLWLDNACKTRMPENGAAFFSCFRTDNNHRA